MVSAILGKNMVVRNSSLLNLKKHYLFPEIQQRKREFLEKHPQAQLISLGIGDTTEPICLPIADAMKKASERLGTSEGYTGYGPEHGSDTLRSLISKIIYRGQVDPDDIFISDGAKCDIGRLQLLFGKDVSILVQDPTYPVYLEGSLLQGVSSIYYSPCLPENNFFPFLNQPTDLIYFCSPNNPTGACATKDQLKNLVKFAKAHQSIILYDAAYAHFIQDENLPKSIYEVPGAEEVAIEINSFSKIAGFTGVRLGWTVVPQSLQYENGASVKNDWKRVTSTVFNGASNIAQKGGEAVLDEKNWKAIMEHSLFYMENAQLLRKCLISADFNVYGGINAPYLWVKSPFGSSWECFQWLMEKAGIVTTPGAGFGPSGEGFIRFSAFSSRKNILEAIKRLEVCL